MNVPVWLLAFAPPVIGALGFFIGVRFMAGKDETDMPVESIMHWQRMWKQALDTSRDNAAAHARCSDSRNTLLSRIDRLKSIALSQQSVKSGRIVAVLEGEA